MERPQSSEPRGAGRLPIDSRAAASGAPVVECRLSADAAHAVLPPVWYAGFGATITSRRRPASTPHRRAGDWLARTRLAREPRASTSDRGSCPLPAPRGRPMALEHARQEAPAARSGAPLAAGRAAHCLRRRAVLGRRGRRAARVGHPVARRVRGAIAPARAPADMSVHPPVVWRHPVLRLALAAAPALLTGTVVFFNTPWSWKALVGSVFAATLWSPYAGFLAAVALAPLGQLIGAFITAGVFRTAEAIVLAFAAAWSLRPLADREGPRVAGAAAAWLFALALAVSVAAQAARLAQVTGERGRLLELLYVAYYLVPDRFGLVESARLVEGIATAAAAVILLRQRPRLAVTLPAVIVGSAAIAAGASVLLWYGIAPDPVLKRHALLGDRVSAHVADVNAAGSYFALAAGVAGGMAARARGRRRLPWAAGAVAVLAGLWLSGSRSAL